MLIVAYHAVGRADSRVMISPERLRRDLEALGGAGYTFVSLGEVADWLGGVRAMPARACAVTFDDGYAGVAAVGLPVLQRLHIPAAVFVITDRLGGDNRWPGQAPWVPPMRLLDRAALRDLIAAGLDVGSHGSSHARLPELDAAAVRAEVVTSADRLEQMIDARVQYFAYPGGFRGHREIALARERYRLAFSSEVRQAGRGSDPHDLPRVDAHDVTVAARLGLFDAAQLTPYLATRRTVRRLRAAVEQVIGR